MNHLNISFFPLIDRSSPPTEVSVLLDTQEKNGIDIAPWASHSYQPKAHFSIAYGSDSVFLKYYVSEKNIRAIHRQINDPVYTDTCVEFFIGFCHSQAYYNFEFNCMGTCQAGYGTSRDDRHLLPNHVIRKIIYEPYLKSTNNNDDDIYWELTLILPFEVFCYENISSLHNTVCRMNFYKCGDELPIPHYLTWNTISSDEPNFHLPQFFGEARFLKLTDSHSACNIA